MTYSRVTAVITPSNQLTCQYHNKAFWEDVIDLEKLFSCESCQSLLSLKNYDHANKKIRCKKGELSYTWKN